MSIMSHETTPKTTSLLLTPLVSPKDPVPHFVTVDNAKHCKECHQPIDSDDLIDCDKCSYYYHLSCTGLPAYELVKYFKKNLYKRKYACKSCVEKLHPSDMHKLEQLAERKIVDETKEQQTKLIDELRKTIEQYEEEIERLTSKLNDLKRKIEKEEEEEEAQSAPPSVAPSDYEAQLRELVSNIVSEKLEENQAAVCDGINQRLTRLEEQFTKNQNRLTTKKKSEDKKNEKEKEPTSQKQNPQRPRVSRPPTCYNCGKVGHISVNCYSRRWPQRAIGFRRERSRNPIRTMRPNLPFFNGRQYHTGTENDQIENERFRTVQTVGEDGRIIVTPQHLLYK